jgi:hypothetical protein
MTIIATNSIKPNEKIIFVKGIRQSIQKSAEWLEERKSKLTTSDAATALGINPYEKPVNLLFKKNNYAEPFIGNVATKHGERYETEAINIYSKLIDRKNYEFGMIPFNSINPIRKYNKKFEDFKLKYPEIDLSFLACSPDGLAVDTRNPDNELVLLEIKCPFRRQIKYGSVPDYYRPQVQLNMFIFDIEVADFIEYCPANVEPKYLSRPEFNIVRTYRDWDWLFENVPKLHKFWNEVLYYRKIGIQNHPDFAKITRKLKIPVTEKDLYDDNNFYQCSFEINSDIFRS